jgi:putative alpha-1,2-mannosidase
MIVGIRESSAWNDHQKLSFSILFSQPIKKIEYYVNGIPIDVENEIAGKDCKAVIYFDDVKEVVLKVAISGIVSDMEGAINNQSEISDFNFDKVKADAQKMWNDELNKIVVETEDTELKKSSIQLFIMPLHPLISFRILTDDITEWMGVFISRRDMRYILFFHYGILTGLFTHFFP